MVAGSIDGNWRWLNSRCREAIVFDETSRRSTKKRILRNSSVESRTGEIVAPKKGSSISAKPHQNHLLPLASSFMLTKAATNMNAERIFLSCCESTVAKKKGVGPNH